MGPRASSGSAKNAPENVPDLLRNAGWQGWEGRIGGIGGIRSIGSNGSIGVVVV
jgi:hypothetical protein